MVGEHSARRRRWDVSSAGACGKENVGISNEMDVETSTPKTQGFLNNAKRIRVSRDLSGSREAHVMAKRLIFLYPHIRSRWDREVTLPRADGIAR